MKVGVFIPGLHGGGAERVIITVANQISILGHEVDLILASDIDNESYKSEITDSVNIVRLGATTTFRSFFSLCTLLRRKKYHSVISTLTSANIVLSIAAKFCLSKSKIVLREANTADQEVKQGGIKLKTLNFLARYTYPLADEVIAVSSSVYASLLNNYHLEEKKLNLIYNPIDFKYVNKHAGYDIGVLKFLKEGDKLVVGIGRLSEQKNYKVLIDAISELVIKDKAYKLIILGDGHLRGELELQITQKKLKDHVFLLGYKDNVFPYLRLADIFVLCSLYEGLPSVLIQAMLCNCRVVVSDAVMSAPEILNGESFGLYFESGNSKHLAEKILEIDKSEVSSAEQADYLRDNFSLVATIPKYIKVLNL